MRVFLVLFPLLLALGVSASRAGEAEDRNAIGDAAGYAFKIGRFAELDATADHYRKSRERTGSGAWKLNEFYNGLRMINLNRNFDGSSFGRYEAQALRWMKERPQSIAAKIAYATLLANHRWYYRGHEFWHKLTPERKEAVREYYIKQLNFLEDVKKEASSDPEWYTLMIDLAMQGGWPDDEFDRLIDEAIKREPYYFDAWFAAITRNRPEWGGSYEKVTKFIRKIAKATQPLEGDLFIARGFWYVDQAAGREGTKSLGLSWAEIDKGFRDFVDLYPHPWNVNAYAKFACQARDRERFLELFARVKRDFVIEIWDDGTQGFRCSVWAHYPERNLDPG